MIKKPYITFSLLILFLAPFSANAKGCKYGDLSLELLNIQTFAETDSYTAILSGTLEMPNPNYKYELIFDEFKDGDKSLRATLSLSMKNPEILSAAVITPIKIDETIQIPHKARRIFIDVIKKFNWGAEYFQTNIPQKVSYYVPICMKAETYN